MFPVGYEVHIPSATDMVNSNESKPRLREIVDS